MLDDHIPERIQLTFCHLEHELIVNLQEEAGM